MTRSTTPLARWNSERDCWESLTDPADLLSGLSTVYSETLPISGSMRSGLVFARPTPAPRTPRFRVFVVAYAVGVGRREGWAESAGRVWGSADVVGGAHAADALSLLPTSVAAEGVKATTRQGVAQKSATGQVWLTNVAHDLVRPDLLPTPAAMNPNDGEGFDTWEARRLRVMETKQNGNGMGMPLAIAAQLLPTPTTAIATGGNAVRGGARSDEKLLPGIVQDDLAKPGTTTSVAEYEALWASLEDQSPFWRTVDGKDYWPAIERWSQVLGRPAPSPTLPDGKGGRHRLNPRLAEWMMGQADGHITAPEIGLTRNQQLKALGNGVVTQQALLALDIAWARRGEVITA